MNRENPMKHLHHDMIVAKAANMDLVVIANQEDKWNELKGWPAWNEHCEYFLCHPKHKDACLHWLNGSSAQHLDHFGGWVSIYDCEEMHECDYHMWQIEAATFRIKPRKEKRWIAVLPNGRVSGWHDKGKEMLKEQYNEEAGWQFIEIEVEV